MVEVLKLQQLGKSSSADMSLRKAIKELQENIAVSWPSCFAVVLSYSSFAHLSASICHSLCKKPLPRLSCDCTTFLVASQKLCIVCRLTTISSSRRRRKRVGGFFLWLNQNKVRCLVYSLKTTVVLQLKMLPYVLTLL